jgi:hypothetical protein
VSAHGWRIVGAPLACCALALACAACDGGAPEPAGKADAGPPEPVCGVGPLEEFGMCPHPIEVPGAEPWAVSRCPELPRGAPHESLLVGALRCGFTGQGDCSPLTYYSDCLEDVPAGFGGRGDTDKIWTDVRKNADGGVDVVWSATELDLETGEPIGAPVEGQLSLGICCEVTYDIYFPWSDVTERVKLQTDWEIKPHCTDDDLCDPDESCLCSDCESDERCTSCWDDGVCNPLSEGCSCSECAVSYPTACGGAGGGGVGGGGGAGGS